MTNTEAIQTIREVLIQVSDWHIQEYAGARRECLFCQSLTDAHEKGCISIQASEALAALDSLAVEPSEDLAESVCLLTRVGKDLHGDPCVILNADGLDALITSRDERIRQDERYRIISKLYDVRGEPDKLNVIIMNESSAIMGRKE